MNKRNFRKYVNQNQELKKWLKENDDWVKSNPEVVRSMMKRLPSHSMGSYSDRPQRSRPHSSGGRVFSKKKIVLPKMNLSTISQATQQLSRTFGMIENLQTIMSIMKLR